MSVDWVGCVVSIDCGATLGFYQGQVTSIDPAEQTVTISQAYRNAVKSEIDKITICARDILDLQILKTQAEAHDIVNKAATPSSLSEETKKSVLPKCASPVKVIHASGVPKTGFNEGSRAANGRNGEGALTSRMSPAHLANGKQARKSPSVVQSQSERNVKTPEREPRPRRNSASENNRRTPDARQRKVSTPKKMERGGRRAVQREDCFSAPAESFLMEFDFEKNLALFDKKAVFEEIENGPSSDSERQAERRPSKYRHDENVLPSQPTDLRQIRVPCSSNAEFRTDTGLVVPGVTQELRCRLLETAEQIGFNTDRLVEMFGRSAAEMVMQLLGGSHRLDPKNEHQLPTVVFLCGPHLQGALGVNCARQLANHGAKVTVFAPSFMRMNPSLEAELKLLELTSVQRTTTVKELPQGPVDMVVNALDSHEHGHLRGQPWYVGGVAWAQGLRAPSLALDPSMDGPAFPAKWSLGLALPLPLPPSCGQQYLCDVGIPAAVFSKVGMDYSSPFCHKFCIPLH